PSAVAPSAVHFAFEGPSTLYLWDFGDGTTIVSDRQTASHTYTADGTYRVELRDLASGKIEAATDVLIGNVLAVDDFDVPAVSLELWGTPAHHIAYDSSGGYHLHLEMFSPLGGPVGQDDRTGLILPMQRPDPGGRGLPPALLHDGFFRTALDLPSVADQDTQYDSVEARLALLRLENGSTLTVDARWVRDTAEVWLSVQHQESGLWQSAAIDDGSGTLSIAYVSSREAEAPVTVSWTPTAPPGAIRDSAVHLSLPIPAPGPWSHFELGGLDVTTTGSDEFSRRLPEVFFDDFESYRFGWPD
ncbi:MAG: PKD domain-containing protein, partial [Acidobacteriota bacterium]